MVPLKYLSNFRITLKMPLISCEINFASCVLVAGIVANQAPTFTITDTKLYVPIVNLSTQNNVKLLQQL